MQSKSLLLLKLTWRPRGCDIALSPLNSIDSDVVHSSSPIDSMLRTIATA